MMRVELVPFATKDVASAPKTIPATWVVRVGGATATSSMVTFWVISWAVAMTVAIPATPDSLMKGTTTTPESPLVVAVTVLAPLTVKRPRSVVKVTIVPAAEGYRWGR